MKTKTFQKSLIKVVILVNQHLVTFIIIPNLLDQYFFLKIVQKTLYTFRHLNIDSEPVDRYESLHQTNTKDRAILSIRTLQGLIGKIEEIGDQTEDSIKGSIILENSFPFFLLVFLVYPLNEEDKERINRFLSFVEVHTRWSKLIDRHIYFQ